MSYYGAGASGDMRGAHLSFNFQLGAPGRAPPRRPDRRVRAPAAAARVAQLGARQPRPPAHRLARRAGAGARRGDAAHGRAPTLYYGDEIGMANVPIPPGRIQDPFERRVPGMGLGRDPVRTPMQWSAAPHAGFTSGEPWLPVSPDHRLVNAAAQRLDPKSMLALHRALIAPPPRRRLELGATSRRPRKATCLPTFSAGADEPSFLVALNLGLARAAPGAAALRPRRAFDASRPCRRTRAAARSSCASTKD